MAQLTDPEINAEAIRVLGKELDLHPDYEFRSIEPVDGGVSLHFVDSHGKERRETFAKVLMAAGRTPNLRNLGLENANVDLAEETTDRDTLQLGEHPIFVAGDVNNLHPLLHEAADDGRIAGENAARFPETIRAAKRRTPLSIVFSDPQIAVVGQSFSTVSPCSAMAGEIDYGDQGRARVQGMNAGKVRIYAEQHTGRLIGAELFGPRVEHTAHLLAWAVQQGLTGEQALTMPTTTRSSKRGSERRSATSRRTCVTASRSNARSPRWGSARDRVDPDQPRLEGAAVSRNAQVRSDERWLADLEAPERRDEAAADLHGFLRGTLARGFGRQLSDQDLDDLGQSAVMRIIERRANYRGDSRFTTWAASVGVNLALGELRRRKHRHASLEELGKATRAAFDTPPEGPHRLQRMQAERVLRDAIDDSLTEAQREALLAELSGMTLMEIARRTGRSRGALYKVLHDARRRLRDRLQAEGLSASDLLDDEDAA